MIAAGQVAATELVLDELKRKDDEAYEWARARSQMFVPIDGAIQSVVRDILSNHPRLVDQRKGRSGADPFVIALAEINNAGAVTDENLGSATKPHIPDVCKARGVRVLSVLELIQEEGWVL